MEWYAKLIPSQLRTTTIINDLKNNQDYCLVDRYGKPFFEQLFANDGQRLKTMETFAKAS